MTGDTSTDDTGTGDTSTGDTSIYQHWYLIPALVVMVVSPPLVVSPPDKYRTKTTVQTMCLH